MSWEPRPVPNVTPETEPYWEAAARGRLLVCRCEACGLVYYYPRSHCPDCLSDETSWVESTGTGSVYSYSITEHVPDWPEAELPLILSYVELEEGPRMLTNIIDCEPDAIEVGMPVRVRFIDTEREDVAIPVFEPQK